MQKFLYFFCFIEFKYLTGSFPYLSNYPHQFSNVAVLPVSCPLDIYKFYVSVKEVDSHNKSRWSDFVLGVFWVTKCGWLWLFTIVDTGMTLTNCCKLFRYGVKRYHYDKFIVIREFLE